MIKPTPDSPLPAAAVDDWNERLERIPAAVAAAVRQAIRDHKAAGNPVAVWQDGRVVWLAPHEIPDSPEARKPSVS
jgi:hypothetical protein